MQGKQAQIEVSQLYTIYVVYFDKVGSGTRDEQGRKRGGKRQSRWIDYALKCCQAIYPWREYISFGTVFMLQES